MQNCTVCYGKKWFAHIDRKTGLQRVHKDGRRIWKCYRCGNIQEESSPVILPKIYRTTANVLYIDLEVSKSLVYNYGLKVPSKYMNFDNLAQEYYIICWSASYLNSDTVWSECVTPAEARKWSDKRILKRLRDLMDSADIIAGHNVDGYDMKRANTRFLLNGLPPVIGKKTHDTLKIARQKFAFESNRLDYISQRLGFRAKDDITNDDWLKIVKTGDKATLAKVNKYCAGDVKNGKDIMQTLVKWSGKKDEFGAVTV